MSGLAGLLAVWLGGWVAGTIEPVLMSRLVNAGLSTRPTCWLIDELARSRHQLAGWLARVCITAPETLV